MELARLKTDQLLIKIIRIIILQKGLDESSILLLRKPSRKRLAEAIYQPSSIQPPRRPAESSITLETIQMLQAVRGILQIDPLHFNELVQSVLHGYQSDYLAKDVLLYRFSLYNQVSQDPRDTLSHWNNHEDAWASKMLQHSHSLSPYFTADSDKRHYLITIMDARGLMPKDPILKFSNNTYALAKFNGTHWISPIIPNTLNPHLDYSFALSILGREPRDMHIEISLWNRTNNKENNNRRASVIEKEDAFLGCVLLTLSDLERLTVKEEKLDAPLQKRTHRSHVSGHIRISAVALRPQSFEIRELHARSFQLMIADQKDNFKAFLKACFDFDYAAAPEQKPNACLSDMSKGLASIIATVWRIRPVYVSICTLQIAFSFFRQGMLVLEHLYDFYLDALTLISDADGPSKDELQEFAEIAGALLEATNYVLRTFFSSLNIERSRAAVSGAKLQKIIVINTSIITSPILKDYAELVGDPFQHVKSLIVESLSSRYHNLVGESQTVDANEHYPLSSLATTLNNELIMYSEYFDIMVMNKMHLPTLAANVFYSPLADQLENLANTYKSSSPEMTTLFELYDAVRKFQRTCESIDYRLADKFKMVKWFGPFVKEWLSYSESKLVEWVRAALEQDNLEHVSSQTPHSSSVLDIFSSFQQLGDFLKTLDWPNELENRRFYFAVFYDILGALYSYCQISTQLMVQLLNSTRKHQPPPPPTTAKVGKFKVPIPKIYRKIVTQSLQGETRISPKACTVLLNIFALSLRFEELVKSIPDLNVPEEEKSCQGSIVDSSRFLYCLTILNGNLKPIRPWMTEVAVKVTNNLGKENGMTTFINQNRQIAWNESIYGLHDSNSATLNIGIWHHIDGQKDSLFAIGQISTNGVQENILEGKVMFDNYGHIYVRLEMLREHPTALSTITKWMVDSTTAKMIKLLVEQLSFDFRERIHGISLKYKSNIIKTTFFKDKIEALTESDISEIEQYLAPFFEFLNSNLEVLMSSMDEALALEVVLGAWKRFVADAEALIAPTLVDDPKERKQWDERRFQFFCKLIEIASEFFHGDGQGLSRMALQTPPYIELQMIMKNYFISKEDAADLYLSLGNEARDNLWLLKLIKMKGGKEFVDSQLESLCR